MSSSSNVVESETGHPFPFLLRLLMRLSAGRDFGDTTNIPYYCVRYLRGILMNGSWRGDGVVNFSGYPKVQEEV